MQARLKTLTLTFGRADQARGISFPALLLLTSSLTTDFLRCPFFLLLPASTVLHTHFWSRALPAPGPFPGSAPPSKPVRHGGAAVPAGSCTEGGLQVLAAVSQLHASHRACWAAAFRACGGGWGTAGQPAPSVQAARRACTSYVGRRAGQRTQCGSLAPAYIARAGGGLQPGKRRLAGACLQQACLRVAGRARPAAHLRDAQAPAPGVCGVPPPSSSSRSCPAASTPLPRAPLPPPPPPPPLKGPRPPCGSSDWRISAASAAAAAPSPSGRYSLMMDRISACISRRRRQRYANSPATAAWGGTRRREKSKGRVGAGQGQDACGGALRGRAGQGQGRGREMAWVLWV